MMRNVITAIIGVIILVSGYYGIILAGEYIIGDENEISVVGENNNVNYTFYSKTDDEIILFPWNKYNEEEVISIRDSEEIKDSHLEVDFYLNITSIFVCYLDESNIKNIESVIKDNELDGMQSAVERIKIEKEGEATDSGLNSYLFSLYTNYEYTSEYLLARSKYQIIDGNYYLFLTDDIKTIDGSTFQVKAVYDIFRQNIISYELREKGKEQQELPDMWDEQINKNFEDIVSFTISTMMENSFSYEKSYHDMAVEEIKDRSFQINEESNEVYITLEEYNLIILYSPQEEKVIGFSLIKQYDRDIGGDISENLYDY